LRSETSMLPIANHRSLLHAAVRERQCFYLRVILIRRPAMMKSNAKLDLVKTRATSRPRRPTRGRPRLPGNTRSGFTTSSETSTEFILFRARGSESLFSRTFHLVTATPHMHVHTHSHTHTHTHTHTPSERASVLHLITSAWIDG